jgi:hypothetical protein
MSVSRALLALGLAGCGASGNASIQTPGPCSPPECALASGLLAMQVTPPSEYQNLLADDDLPMAMFDQSGVLQLALASLVHIQGVVHIGSASGTKLMNGTVLATRPSRIAGRPDRSYQALIDPASGRYALAVSQSLPNEQYTLRIVGTDPSQFAPQTFSVIADGDTMFDPVIDDRTSLSVINVFGSIKDQLGMGVANMQVQAITSDTQTPVSTIAVTDTSGSYSIYLSSTVRKLTTSTLNVVATPLPNVTQPNLKTSIDISAMTNSFPASMMVPPMQAAQSFRYPVIGVGSSGAEMPIAGATCLFTVEVTQTGSTTFAEIVVEAQTDSEGGVTVQLVPSQTYSVAISPPANSDFASEVKSIVVGANGGVGQTQMLSLRPRLQGRLLDPSVRPVPGVTVEPGPASVSAADAASLALVNKIATTVTDSSGRFVLRVDPTKQYGYDIALVPASGQFLPRRWLPRTQVTADTDLGDVLLPRGTVARVIISDPGGNPLLGASVQIYQIDPGNAACPAAMPGCLAPPRLLAEGTSDGTGQLQALLPAAN